MTIESEKTEIAFNLAINLMREHGLTNWNFKFDRAISRFGCCNFKTKTISVSRKLTEINEISKVKDTILHEIAHALVGISNGHSHIWRSKAISIGCNGNTCYSAHEVVTVPRKWTGTCPNGHTSTRNKRSKTSCGKCSNKFDPDYMIIWTENII